MDVFISWSGKTSGKLAKELSDWLPSVIQAVKPFYSKDNIEKGSRGSKIVDDELEKANIGLLCLTRGNLEAPWIMFEAGSLSKRLDISRVCPILFEGLQITDLKPPLSNLQASSFNKDEMKKVMYTINNQLGDNKLKDSVLNDVFNKFWPDLEKKVNTILSKTTKTTTEEIRDQRDILEEILTLCRSSIQFLQAKEKVIPTERIQYRGATLTDAKKVTRDLLVDGFTREGIKQFLFEAYGIEGNVADTIINVEANNLKPKIKSKKKKYKRSDNL